MNSSTYFLDQVAIYLHEKHREEMGDLTLLVPSYEVGNTLVRKLARMGGKTSWAPWVYTLPAFMKACSPLHIPKRLQLLSLLYEIAREKKITKEGFADFLSWGGQILDDFEHIDDYLVSSEALFKIPDPMKDTDSLPEALRPFWETMQGDLSLVQKRWLALWNNLPVLYNTYRERLLAEEMAYPALQKRVLYESLTAGKWKASEKNKDFKRVFGIGLHALTPCEEKILRYMGVQFPLSFCWDRDPYYCKKGRSHPAGHAFRKREKEPFFANAMKQAFTSDMKATPPEVEVIATGSLHGQVNALCEGLDQLIEEKGIEEVTEKSVIIMPDRSLFLPLLHGLPKSLGDVNFKGGYPLTSTPAYTLLLAMLRFQMVWKESKGVVSETLLKAVDTLCGHPYLKCDLPTRKKLQEVATGSLTKLLEMASGIEFLGMCIQPLGIKEDIFITLQKCFSTIKEALQEDKALATWEKVALDETDDMWKEIGDVFPQKEGPRQPLRPLIELLHQQALQRNLMLSSASNKGSIAVMSLSDTLGLNFDYVFILSMNEGTLPPSSDRPFFVPYLLRKNFHFPNAKDYEADVAYPLYRLLAHAQKVFCFYGTGEGSTGERSHYLHELTYGLGWEVRERSWMPDLILPSHKEKDIEKSDPVMERLARFELDNDASHVLTPSAVSRYLDCPRCFYLHHIADVRKTEPLGGEMDAPTFGKLFHYVMEDLYKPYVGELLISSTLSQLKKGISKSIKKAYSQVLPYVGEGRSTDLIVTKVLASLVEQVISQDIRYAPFTLYGLEERHGGKSTPLSFTLSNGLEIAMGGVIDRVDKKKGTVRVIDYKTGNYSRKIDVLESLFSPATPSRNRAAFQLFWYAWLYKKQHSLPDEVFIMPEVISTRTAWKDLSKEAGFFMADQGKDANTFIDDFTPYLLSFETNLRKVVDEIFDPRIPFRAIQEGHGSYGLCTEVFV